MTIIIVEFCMHDKPIEDILSNNGFNRGEGIVGSSWVPSTQTLLLCTALFYDHTTSCTQRGTYHHRPGEGQRELHALSWPIAEYRHHVLPPNPSPIYLGEIFCEGQSTYSPQVELVASSQIDGRPARDDAPPLSKSKSMAPRPSKYAARRCNTQAGSPTYACTAPIQSAQVDYVCDSETSF